MNENEPSVAQNQMNFGNYMYALSGLVQEFTLFELSYGAHKNSRFPEDENGNRYGSGNPILMATSLSGILQITNFQLS